MGKLRSTQVQILALNIGYLTSDKEDNELYTPYYAVDHIIKYLPKDKIYGIRSMKTGLLSTTG